MKEHDVMIRLGALLAAGAMAIACSDDPTSTELNPEGPPMVLQVFAAENVPTDGGEFRPKFQLAFGDHPEIPLPDEDPVYGDDRQVNNAIARGGEAKLRVVMDEIIRGNSIEEVACDEIDPNSPPDTPENIYSPVPDGADPDDLKDCSGADLSRCRAVCIFEGRAVGILDENEDGAPDKLRMRDYAGCTILTPDDCEFAVGITCGDVHIPLDRNFSYYTPSGNQLLPAVDPPNNINGLGPALVLLPRHGLKTGSECTVTFRSEVKDKDGNGVCAPEGGDIDAGCQPGDTSRIAFTTEALLLEASDPEADQVDVPLTDPGVPQKTLIIEFNASMSNETLNGIQLEDMDGTAVDFSAALSATGETILLTVAEGLLPETTYTLTLTTGLTDRFGTPLPQEIVITFTTAAAEPA
jgi:hypothetical protein